MIFPLILDLEKFSEFNLAMTQEGPQQIEVKGLTNSNSRKG